jgi:type I restriction enzyme S subunit
MMSGYFQAQLKTLSTGSTAEGLKASKLPMLWLVAPPVLEQQTIAEAIQRETEKVKMLIESISSAISRLEELRAALISAAVTGKIDVREEVV